MERTNKLRVGMVGVGGFGGQRRAYMRETGLFELAAAYDYNREALAACEREDGARPMNSYEELLSVPGLEAVVISTGALFHAEQAVAAMERGLHVFVEKPLCSTSEEVGLLMAAQRSTQRVVGMGHHDHGQDAFSLTVKRMIEDGELGKIVTFEKTTGHNGGLQIKPGDWRGDPARNPGGMLFQCGVHAFHELMYYFGPIVHVTSMMRYDIHTTQTADVAVCLLEFKSGLVGTVNAFHVSPYRHAFHLFGTRKNLYANHRFFDEGTLAWTQTTCFDNSKEPMVPLEIREATDPCSNLRSFYRAVREGGELYPSLKDGARAVSVVFAAEQAAKSGRTVEVRYEWE